MHDSKTLIGTYYFAKGDKYEGEWKDDNTEGKGKHLIYCRDDILKQLLIGILYMANGDKYDGEWKDSQKNGKGRIV